MKTQLMETPTKYPFVYKARNAAGHLSNYSDPFKSLAKAEKWYKSHGKFLELKFNRELILVHRKYRYNPILAQAN